jgi:hypothetical protein
MVVTVSVTKKPDKPPGKPPGGGGQPNRYTISLASGLISWAVAHVISTSGGAPPAKVMALAGGRYLIVGAKPESEKIVYGEIGLYKYTGAEGIIE